jgi:HlyD family secretion protein
LLLVAAVAAGAGYFVVVAWLGPVVTADRVVRADYVQTVVATGYVAAPNRINIGSQITGIVTAVPVHEGQVVQKGDVLVRLADREGRAGVVQAEGAVAQAEARLRQMRELTLPTAREALSQAQATLANAQKTYDRAATLARDSYGTIAALDSATRDLNIARA